MKQCVDVAVTATSESGEAHTAQVALAPGTQLGIQAACPGASIAISILGFEQSGAVSTSSSQKFFFDFFQSYPLPLESARNGPKADIYGPPWRWWSDLRIASYPQQVTAPVSQFSSQFALQGANLPVNKLAQSGEFRLGLERRIVGFQSYFLRGPGTLYERTSLGAFFYFGAQGGLSSPVQTAEVFNMPTPGTPQRAAFDRAFPVSSYPDLALPATAYAGFIPPSRDGAYRQCGAGFRLTTHFFNANGRMLQAPAMISASFGQNELVTAGKRRGVAGTFEGFYPLPLGLKSKEIGTIYLFGRTSLALDGFARRQTQLALIPAPAIPIIDPSVPVIALPGSRDTYTIGVGIDAVEVLKGLFNLSKSVAPSGP